MKHGTNKMRRSKHLSLTKKMTNGLLVIVLLPLNEFRHFSLKLCHLAMTYPNLSYTFELPWHLLDIDIIIFLAILKIKKLPNLHYLHRVLTSFCLTLSTDHFEYYSLHFNIESAGKKMKVWPTKSKCRG